MIETAQQRELLTVAEAADYLRVSRQTVRALVHRGDVPAVKAGPATNSPIRIRRDELERWLFGPSHDNGGAASSRPPRPMGADEARDERHRA